MAKSAASLDGVPLRNLKTSLDTGEEARQKKTRAAGWMVRDAMHAAHMEPKQLADHMGVSVSFLLRGFKDLEHISFQRIQLVDDDVFQDEFVKIQTKQRATARMFTMVEWPERKVRA